MNKELGNLKTLLHNAHEINATNNIRKLERRIRIQRNLAHRGN